MILVIVIAVLLLAEACLIIPDKLPFLRKRCKK
jgi:hypothetical protein